MQLFFGKLGARIQSKTMTTICLLFRHTFTHLIYIRTGKFRKPGTTVVGVLNVFFFNYGNKFTLNIQREGERESRR